LNSNKIRSSSQACYILALDCSAQQCTNRAWCPRRTADAEQRSKWPITY